MMSLSRTLSMVVASTRHSQAFERHPLRVLVVDDEEPVRKFVQQVLNGAGVTTWSAAGAEEALRLVHEIDGIDLLLTDLQMPHMNGDELARLLRRDDPALKVLYLTGFSDRLFADRAMLWEDEAFLDKPCTINGLLEAVSLATTGRISRNHDTACVEGRA
ncbi:MAG TPA: response regulator [Vicinamibacterales bacterium]|nr:response regulator [Vicinamibacterales bacterium]